MVSSACTNNTMQVTANSGTISSPSYSWLASPSGVVFSSTNIANPVLTFTAPGNYSVLVAVASGTLLSYAQNTINVISSGQLLVLHSSLPPTNSVCPQTSFAISAYAGAGTSFSVFTAPNTLATSGTSSVLPLVAPGSAGFPKTYTVATDSAGCRKSAVITMYEHALTLFASASQSVVCPMTQFSLQAQAYGISSYSFIAPPGNVVASGTANVQSITAPLNLPATFTILADSSTCRGSATISIDKPLVHPQLTQTSGSVCAGNSVTLTTFGVGSNANFPTYYSYSVLSSTVPFQANTSPSTVVSPTSQTSYVVVADSLGCAGAATVTIYMANPLNILVSPSSLTTCIISNSTSTMPALTKPILLTASGASTYSWSSNAPGFGNPTGPTVTTRPQTTSQYTVVGATPICTGTTVITVSVAPQFTIGATPAQSTICSGNNITLGVTQIGNPANSPFTYEWVEQDQLVTTLNSTSSPSVFASPSSQRSYSVTVVDGNGCISSPSSVTVDVAPCTDISEGVLKNIVSIYPNPVRDELFISNPSSDLVTIEIKEICGKIILAQQLNRSCSLSMREFASGVYFVQAQNSLHSQTLKIVKE